MGGLCPSTSLPFTPLSQKSLKSFWYRACHTVSIQWVTVNESMWPLFLFSIIQHQLTFYLTLLSKFHCRLSLHKLCSIFFQLPTLILPANFGWFQGKPHDSDLALFSFSILLIILQLAKILTNTEFFLWVKGERHGCETSLKVSKKVKRHKWLQNGHAYFCDS